MIIDVDKAITLTCFKFMVSLAYEVEIRKIPIKGTNSKSVSNISKEKFFHKCSSVWKLILDKVS